MAETKMVLERVYSPTGELLEEKMVPWTPPDDRGTSNCLERSC